jgi:hypothetical protein
LFWDDIESISAGDFNNVIVKYAKEQQKSVCYFMHTSDQEVDLKFRALSQHPLFQDDVFFTELRDPDPQFFIGLDMNLLPTIGVVGKLDDNFKDGEISQ